MISEEEYFNDPEEQSVESIILDEISILAKQIESSFPGATATIEIFPSSAAMLDIRLNNRLFVMDYSPTNGFGVDEVGEEDGFNTGYRFGTKDIYVAIEELKKLLSSTEQ